MTTTTATFLRAIGNNTHRSILRSNHVYSCMMTSKEMAVTKIPHYHLQSVFFTTTSQGNGNGKQNDDKNKINTNTNTDNKSNDKEDPFGLNYNDTFTDPTSGNIGPKEEYPPSYVRDPITGKLTGDIEQELTSDDKRTLQAAASDELAKQLMVNHLKNKLSMDNDRYLEDAARAIREERTALGTIGRKVSDVLYAKTEELKEKEQDEDDAVPDSLKEEEDDDYVAPLSPSEFESLSKLVLGKNDTQNTAKSKNKNQPLLHDQEYLLPRIARKSTYRHPSDSYNPSSDDAQNNNSTTTTTTTQSPPEDMEWIQPSSIQTLAGQTTDSSSSIDNDNNDDDDPFANLLPHDLNPARLVNRRNAKPLPPTVLHHNNLSLLRRYVTPGGQIMPRAQTRLGAKDQRKITKMIKRARHLGLIPFLGQWKVEDMGNLREEDLNAEREWEKDLRERGFVVENQMEKK